jgi:ribonuclease E
MLESELYDREFDDAAKGGSGAGEVSPAIPAAVFQPPQVVFQPPQVRPETAQPAGATRTRGNGAASGASIGAGGAAGARPDGDGTASGDNGDGQDGADGADGRRRRRRTSRTRTRAGGPDDQSADADLDGSDAGGSEDETADAPAAQGTRTSTRRSRSRTSAATSEASSAGADSGAASAVAGSDAGLDDADDGDDDGDGDSGTGTGRRRRRKRRRGGVDGADSLAADDPPDTVVHVREPNINDDVRSVKGSTRLEAKKQRRREGRETGRRRPPVITESEFLARRESVERTMVVRQRDDRTQIAVLEDGVLVEHYVNRSTHQSYVGNVYLGKVQNVLPSMEAAFVDIGKGRNAVLYAGEVNFDVSGLEGQPKRIESALKAGQSLIVQVTKDPVGHKGARLTSQVSLPGRYLVYVPGASMTGISRKLPDTERNRLKQILKKVMPENAGVIVRTAAEGAAEEELARDVSRLAAQWEAIDKKAKTASAPALLYSEPDLTIRVIRDVFNEDFAKLMVAGDQGWDTVDEYVKYVAPHLADRLSRWSPDNGQDVFASYRIDEQLAKALERKVWLPSGGSLVIDKTEAMTVIDVNTGKFTGQGGNLEETVTRNNLEAAEEIVRQLRLRDVGGIVVIDFIDMVLESNRELVLRRLLECLARDRTKHQVAEVTSLGLVQMTRKRVGAGLLEAFSHPCECCNGRGVILTYETDAEGRSTGHVHPRPTELPGSGNGGASNGSHGGNGSGGSGGSTGSGGSAGAGSGAGSGSGGRVASGRSRRGSRGRGGAVTPATVAAASSTAVTVDSPATAQAELGDGHHATDGDQAFGLDTGGAHADGSRGDAGQDRADADRADAAEAAAPQASTGGSSSSSRRRRRKSATATEPAVQEAPGSDQAFDPGTQAEDGAA